MSTSTWKITPFHSNMKPLSKKLFLKKVKYRKLLLRSVYHLQNNNGKSRNSWWERVSIFIFLGSPPYVPPMCWLKQSPSHIEFSRVPSPYVLYNCGISCFRLPPKTFFSPNKKSLLFATTKETQLQH